MSKIDSKQSLRLNLNDGFDFLKEHSMLTNVEMDNSISLNPDEYVELVIHIFSMIEKF